MLRSESKLFQISFIVIIWKDDLGDNLERGIFRVGMSSELAWRMSLSAMLRLLRSGLQLNHMTNLSFLPFNFLRL